jgi:hypothetical protein
MIVKNYPITGLDMPLGLRAHEGGNASPRHRPPLPPEDILCTHFC